MTRPAKPVLLRFGGGWLDEMVIVGAHLTIEEARSQFGEEYAAEKDEEPPATIDAVRHAWVRWEFLGENNCPDGYDPEYTPACWLLYKREARPKGIVRKATVIE